MQAEPRLFCLNFSLNQKTPADKKPVFCCMLFRSVDARAAIGQQLSGFFQREFLV